MAVFISYSSYDVTPVEQLAATLRRAREEIWYASELGGGQHQPCRRVNPVIG